VIVKITERLGGDRQADAADAQGRGGGLGDLPGVVVGGPPLEAVLREKKTQPLGRPAKLPPGLRRSFLSPSPTGEGDLVL